MQYGEILHFIGVSYKSITELHKDKMEEACVARVACYPAINLESLKISSQAFSEYLFHYLELKTKQLIIMYIYITIHVYMYIFHYNFLNDQLAHSITRYTLILEY